MLEFVFYFFFPDTFRTRQDTFNSCFYIDNICYGFAHSYSVRCRGQYTHVRKPTKLKVSVKIRMGYLGICDGFAKPVLD